MLETRFPGWSQYRKAARRTVALLTQEPLRSTRVFVALSFPGSLGGERL